MYLANTLVNLQDLGYTFYKIDLLFEHWNREFKKFCIDRRSFLQKSDEIFCLHILLVNFLRKVCYFLN